jgi:hypothetical protein
VTQTQTERFNCTNCGGKYKVIRVEVIAKLFIALCEALCQSERSGAEDRRD